MRNNAGFTLLELILATAIFAILSISAGMGVMAVQQNWRKIHEHSEKLKNLMAIDRVVESSFRNIIPFTWPEEGTYKEISVFQGEPDKILYASIHRINEGDNNALRFIRLFNDNGNLVAEYRNSPIIADDDDNTGIRREVLSQNVKKLSFLYLSMDETGQIQWKDDWDEKAENQDPVPIAVQMNIEWENGESCSWLRRTAGAGKNESLGKRLKKGAIQTSVPTLAPATGE